MIESYQKIILMVATTFAFSLLMMPLMKRIAFHIGALDIPKDNRRMKTETIPKLGGLGIFLSFLFGYVLFGVHSIQMNSILIGSFILIILAIIDDIKALDQKIQLVVQLIAAALIPLSGNIVLTDISAFGIYINFGVMSIPLTIFFIVAVINIINLIDGIDGLSSGIGSIYFLTIGIIALMMGGSKELEIFLTFIMLGSTLGFLLHNFYPAKIFMGESSMFLGYIIAVISLLGFKNVTVTSFIIPVFLLAIPIFDTACAIIRRKIQGKRMFEGDKQHLHHQIYYLTNSVTKTVLIIYLVDILFAAASILYITEYTVIAIIVYVILFLIIFWLLLTTSIIKERKQRKLDNIKKEEMKVKESIIEKKVTKKVEEKKKDNITTKTTKKTTKGKKKSSNKKKGR